MKANISLSPALVLGFAMTTVITAAERIAVQANTDFGLELYAQLAEENPGENLFFSPYSVANALAMTAEGARDGTALEMGTVLGLPDSAKDAADKLRPWDMDALHEGIGALNKHFNRAEKPYALSVANAIWGEKSFPFNKEFIGTINGAYGTNALRLANFVGNAEAERQRINTWVEEQTEERIKDLLPKGSIDGMTRLVLTNAIYFKGDWKSQFDEKYTKEDDFALAGGGNAKAQLMAARSMTGAKYAAFNADGSFFNTPGIISRGKKVATYPAGDGFAMVELPYKGDELSMVVIAPNSAAGLPTIEAKLNRANLDGWLGKLKARKLHVTLPKFKSETTYTLNSALKAMGMPSAFGRGSNFDGMVEGESKADLYISLVVHKAFVEVNEEGTEAAAATGVVMAIRSARISTPFIPQFRADKPFIYLIRDKKSGSILFIGRMNNPAS